MLNKNITRAEFLRKSIVGAIAILVIPVLRISGHSGNVSDKNAKYYKDLAG
jgi:hypothetical protein